MRDRTYIKDNDASPLEPKQIKKEPPPVANKKISIGQNKSDDVPSTPPPTAPKVNTKPNIHKRHRRESTMLNDSTAENTSTQNDALLSPTLPKTLSVDDQNKRDADEVMLDQKDPVSKFSFCFLAFQCTFNRFINARNLSFPSQDS